MSNEHYGKLTAVVIRQLNKHRPVVSAVIEQSSDKDVDDQCHYLLSKAEEHMVDFQKTFVEFNRANWFIDIIEEHTNKIMMTKEFLTNPPYQP